ncbi:MAG TPA: hypothetical protein DHV51_03630 [Opitutae bacterium]|nr:hypothetical protein [Opitutae bacterium]
MVHFPKIHVNDQKSLLLEALFAKLDGIKKRLGRDPNVYIFGTTPVAQFLAEMLRESKRFLIKAFLTTREKQTARTLNGMPWVTLEDLNPLEVDAVVNTSIGSQDYINELLKANSFGEIICFLDDTSLEIDDVFQKKFYLPELGPVESFSELEYAYKEHRILMTKSHPYSKGEKCSECDLMSICDGFHKDYAKFFGFDEATSIRLPSKTYDPRYYSCQQRKVVEEQEYAWIFTDAEREQLCADTPR